MTSERGLHKAGLELTWSVKTSIAEPNYVKKETTFYGLIGAISQRSLCDQV